MSSTDSDISTLTAEDIAPYAFNGPIALSAQRFLNACDQMEAGILSSTVRAWSTVALFGAMENVFASHEDPIPAINEALDRITEYVKTTHYLGTWLARSLPTSTLENTVVGEIEQRTGSHYSSLFGQFSPDSFWDEATNLLKTRLERNHLDSKLWAGKSVLDAGCGGGRYTVAWRKLGASTVTGLDLSDANVTDASARVDIAKLDAVKFQQGNVLALPFADDSFDVVFSNGVLHHTVDWKKGVKEIVRVLKPGGFGWLYLIENPGGLYWGLIEVLRLLMKNENGNFARKTLSDMGIPANRVFYMLDHVMAPVNSLLTSEEIEQCLVNSGAKNVERLKRGVDFDRIEKIFRNEPHAAVKYGIGENRHIFSK